MPGVVYHLMQDSSNLRFRDLAGTKKGADSKKEYLPPWLSFILVNAALFYAFQFAVERFRA